MQEATEKSDRWKAVSLRGYIIPLGDDLHGERWKGHVITGTKTFHAEGNSRDEVVDDLTAQWDQHEVEGRKRAFATARGYASKHATTSAHCGHWGGSVADGQGGYIGARAATTELVYDRLADQLVERRGWRYWAKAGDTTQAADGINEQEAPLAVVTNKGTLSMDMLAHALFPSIVARLEERLASAIHVQWPANNAATHARIDDTVTVVLAELTGAVDDIQGVPSFDGDGRAVAWVRKNDVLEAIRARATAHYEQRRKGR